MGLGRWLMNKGLAVPAWRYEFNPGGGVQADPWAHWPASLAINELQVWRETLPPKVRWRLTRGYPWRQLILPFPAAIMCLERLSWGKDFVPLSPVHAGTLCGLSLFTQGLCLLSQWLWVHMWSCPVVHRGHCFLVIIYCLWLLDSFRALFSDPWASGGRPNIQESMGSTNWSWWVGRKKDTKLCWGSRPGRK